MKIKIINYTFNKTTKTITFVGYASIKLESVLLITNVTQNKIIYNFANPALGGTVATNVLTLAYDTSTMENTDKLMIMYEDDAQSLWDKLVQIYGYLGTMMGNFGGWFTSISSWWDTVIGWKYELDSARATARQITDTKGIPALDKINNGNVGVNPSAFYMYTSDAAYSYYDLSNINVGSDYNFRVGDKLWFTGTNQYSFVKSNNYSGTIELATPLDTPPYSYETIYIYRKVNPNFDSSGNQYVTVTNMGGSGTAQLVGNMVQNFTSASLDFTYPGTNSDIYNIDQFSEINFIIEDTGWQGGSGVYVYASADGGNTWTSANVRDYTGYYNSYISSPGGYTFDTAGFNVFRLQIGSGYGGYYAGVQFNGRPVGKSVQQVEMVNGLSGTMTAYQGTSPWTMGPYKQNVVNTTTALTIGATYNSGSILANTTSEFYVHISTLQDSALDGVIFEGNNDNGATWYPISGQAPFKQFALSAGQISTYRVVPKFYYFRMRYINGAVATGTPFSIRINSNTVPQDESLNDQLGNKYMRGAFLPTYSACTDLFVPDGTATTDTWDFYGVNNREIQIQKIIISGYATADTVTYNWSLSKRSTAPTGGTSTSPTKIPLSTAFNTSSATIRSYTVKPTSLGTALGNIFKKGLKIPAINTGTLSPILELDFMDTLNCQSITLNGALEGIALNLGGVAIAGLNLQVMVIYTESPYLT